MTNDQRLDRIERYLTLLIKGGKREQRRKRALDEKIAILRDSQKKTQEVIRQMRADRERRSD